MTPIVVILSVPAKSTVDVFLLSAKLPGSRINGHIKLLNIEYITQSKWMAGAGPFRQGC